MTKHKQELVDIKKTIEGNALKMNTEAGTELIAVEVNVAIAIAEKYAESILVSLANKLESESTRCTLAINFDGHTWEVGDMYGYGVATYEGKDIASLIEFIKE